MQFRSYFNLIALELSSTPYVVNQLSVSVQASGKKRLILDLRHVNQYSQTQRVKYKDWKVALLYFQKGSYMISFDLKSGYHHIYLIHADYQQFLGFAWKWSDEPSFRVFTFTILPFGLASAPRVFTKCLKLIEKYWRFQGVRIALFLDDGWLIENSLSACRVLSCKIKTDFYNAGLVSNDEKSIWQLSQSIEWLGIIWNSVHGTIHITGRRSSIHASVDSFVKQTFVVSARELSSFNGKIISAGAVFGNVSRIMTRHKRDSILEI